MDSAAALPAGSQSIVPAFFHSQEGFRNVFDIMIENRIGDGLSFLSNRIKDTKIRIELREQPSKNSNIGKWVFTFEKRSDTHGVYDAIEQVRQALLGVLKDKSWQKEVDIPWIELDFGTSGGVQTYFIAKTVEEGWKTINEFQVADTFTFMGTDRPGPGKCGFSSEIFDYIVQPALGQLLTQAGCQMTITHIKNRGVKTFYDDKYVSRDIPALRVAFPKI